MTRRLTGLALAGVVVSGCIGPSPQASPSPSPIPSVSSVPPPRYLVLQATNGAAATVLIIDLHGAVVAKASFVPAPTPQFANCQSVTQPPVHAAAGAAFFADSKGVVHRLDPTGKVTDVATFKLGKPNQFLSYAVSPRGDRLIASVVTAASSWTLDLELANAGGATTIVKHADLGADPSPGPVVIAGWDSTGPTATADSGVCVAQEPASAEYAGGSLVHLSTAGDVINQVGGPGCAPLDELADGTVLCAADRFTCGTFIVRQAGGTELWRSFVKCPFVEPRLSPDGQAVAAAGAGAIIYRRGSDRPASFARTQEPDVMILGWAGSGLVLAARADGELGVAVPINPLQFQDLGLNPGDARLAGALP